MGGSAVRTREVPMCEIPDGWCAAPFRFEPENMHGDPAPRVMEFTREQIEQFLADRSAHALAYFDGEHS
jgi:hypothetical protein